MWKFELSAPTNKETQLPMIGDLVWVNLVRYVELSVADTFQIVKSKPASYLFKY